jgi:hypothetical protein
LGDLGAVDDDPARAVRKFVLSFLLAVARVAVNGRLAKTTSWKSNRPEPEVLDPSLASFVVGEEIARQPKPVAADLEKLADELDKESDHRWVRVREHDFVSLSRSFGPKQHAAGRVAVAQTSGPLSTVLLSRGPSRSSFRSHCRAGQTLALVQPIPCLQRSMLCVGQLDVTHPVAHGGRGHPEKSRNLFDRTTLFMAHPTRLFSLGCFHF